jgi:hypothetical protein
MVYAGAGRNELPDIVDPASLVGFDVSYILLMFVIYLLKPTQRGLRRSSMETIGKMSPASIPTS